MKVLTDWIAQGAKIDGPPKSEVPPVVIPQFYASAPAVSSVTISQDGKLAAAACRSEVAIFNVDDDTVPQRVPTDFDLINHVELSPDGKRLAVAGGSPQQFGGIIFFDPADGKRESRAADWDRHALQSETLAPDGPEAIAVGGPTGRFYLIPVEDEKAPVKSIELHSDWVTAVAYTPDGKELVSGSRDKTTKISSAEKLSLLRSVDESKEMINAVAADSLTAISGGNARDLLGFDFKQALVGMQVTGSGNGAQPVNNRGQYLRAFEAQPEAVMAMATSGDRKLLAVATRASEVRIYSTENRQRKVSIPNVPAPVLSVALNQDGSRLIVGCKSGVVQVWDTGAGKLIKSLTPVPVQQAVAAQE